MGPQPGDGVNFAGQVVRWFLDPGHWRGVGGIPHRLFEHLAMSGLSLLAAAIIALSIGITLGHLGRGGNLAINISNVGRALPSFALLVLAFELFGGDTIPAFIALVALGIPPMVTNSYIGVREVDQDVREAARGMGMRARAVLLRVELPIALPFIMAGVRTSAVNIVATATLAALIGWGGLGRYVVDGLGLQDYPQLFAGAVLVGALALIVEFSFVAAQQLLAPSHNRQSRNEEVPGTLIDAAA